MSKKVLIYGGRGALGSTMVSHFQSCGWWVCSVDLAASDAADANVIVDPKADWLAQESNSYLIAKSCVNLTHTQTCILFFRDFEINFGCF